MNSNLDLMMRRLIVISLFVFLMFEFTTFGANETKEVIPPHYLVKLNFQNSHEEIRNFNFGKYDVVEISWKKNYAILHLQEQEYYNLLFEGWNLEIIMTPTELSTITIDPEYLRPEEVEQLLEDYANNYPEICMRVSLGQSWEGRDIWAVKISDNVTEEEDEPEILFNGMHHAREVMSPEVPVDIIDYLCTNYGTDPQVTQWVDNWQIWVVPMVNPDGNAYCWDHYTMWRKNRRDNGNGTYGVDLNRNYPFLWNYCGGSSGIPSENTYRGPSPASEPETQAMIGLANAHHFVFDISYHSYSELVIYPYGCPGIYTPDHQAISSVGETMASLIERDNGQMGYEPGTPWELLYAVDGDDIAWHYGVRGTFAYVIELNSSAQGFQPPYSWRDSTVERNRPAWQYLLNRINGPSIQGHVLDACTGNPLEAEISLQEVNFELGESARTSDPNYGRFTWIVVPGTYHITFTKDGYYPVTMEVNVGNEAYIRDFYLIPLNERELLMYNYLISDLEGDADGILDPGEEVSLIVTAIAPGLGVTGISATISTSDPYITIIDDTAEFPDIPSGGSAESLEPHFRISADENTPEGHIAEFTITFSANEQLCVYQDTFEIRVTSYVYICPVLEETLDEDPNWDIQNSGGGGWEFGHPTVGPNSGHTGDYVYGTNLDGNYENNGTYILTSTPFDCTNIENAELHFYRWLHNESGYDTAYVKVSNDNVNWTIVWSGYANDSDWQEVSYDISEVADHQENVYIRFELHTDVYITYEGFYIDDIEICGNSIPAPNLRINSFTIDDTAGSCSDSDGFLDAGEEAYLTIELKNIGYQASFNTIGELVTSNPDVEILTNNINFGDILPQGGTSEGIFHIRALNSVQCQEELNLTLNINAENFTSSEDFSFILDQDEEIGNTNFEEDVEGEVSNWNLNGWSVSSSQSHEGDYSFFSGSNSNLCNRLVSKQLYLTPGYSHTLSFWTYYNIESGWDGGLVQVTVDGENWETITPNEGYPSSTNSSTSACIGRNTDCFTGSGTTWTLYTFNLDDYSGQTIQIGFLYGSDSSVNYTGWFIDDITVENVTMPYITCDDYPCEEEPTPTQGPTNTPTPTFTPVPTNTPTPTFTPTNTYTPLPTNTPLPTSTNVPTMTPVPTNTFTPVPTYTQIPTSTPTHPATTTPVPTFTYIPTFTPVPTEHPTNTPIPPTPTTQPAPTYTPTQLPQGLTIDLILNQKVYYAGDHFLFTVNTYNNGPEITVDEYIVLDVWGTYYFWPSWSQNIDKVQRTLDAYSTDEQVILDFIWPFGAGSGSDIVFWGVYTYPDTYDLASNIDSVSFDFR